MLKRKNNGMNMIRPVEGKIHWQFDMKFAKSVYREWRNTAVEPSGPFDVYSNEMLRREYIPRTEAGVVADILVFGLGEPADPRCSKVGGIPAWPKDWTWPTTTNGSPYYFLAQFNFAASLDIVPEVPQPLLVILSDVSDDEWIYRDKEHLHFFWVSSDAVLAESFRPPTVSAIACFGSIFRCCDYPSVRYGNFSIGSSYKLATSAGTKIGGSPFFFEDRVDENGFICQLGPIFEDNVRFPWTNVPLPGTLRDIFMIADGGVTRFFLESDGSVRWHFESA